MNEEELLHLIGKLTSYLDDHYETYSVLENTDDFTEEDIVMLTKCKKEYEFWYKMTSEQKVITYSDNIGNPCCEILLK